MNSLKVKAPAKINLSLDIIGVLPNGYHSLCMIMQSVTLFDEITVTKKDSGGIVLTCDAEGIPLDKRNIIYKVAKKFFEHADIAENVSFHLKKVIPSQAGLGGGSADGAAVLKALNKLYITNFSDDKLCEIGVTVGADIPFCIKGGTALVGGIGEKITPLKPMPDCDIVIVKPKAGIDTAKAFADSDNCELIKHPDTYAILSAIDNEDLGTLSQNLCNVLEQVAGLSEIDEIKSKLLARGAIGALMTGSGSAVFGIFDNHSIAKDCCEVLSEEYKDTFLVQPYRDLKEEIK